ncbi:uncharacterized protein MELLADRAFT_68167 [Melampsora larici-populina 98AG31]|uniref:Secreted protein n=1 Tax=Melampsora larici-populina (strain 98AG31 / pathotype 3-4-7) TaxID=747676 RepID=F4S5T5_MELLP|nr:uncharacterized protein MELLADRAFT_68167 [Melampsora larici-populina 98AG31]EGF99953.1 secreted protein [Melampsora larici-populina 98AG31]
MQFGVIFLALFFLTISHVQCGPDDDIKNRKVVAIPFKKFSDGQTRILLVTMKDNEDKGPMFVRGHVKEREASNTWNAANRETEEETGFENKVGHSGETFVSQHPKKRFDITMHPYTVEITSAVSKDTVDKGKRRFEWVLPSQVEDRISKDEMVQAWGKLRSVFHV